MRLLSKQHFLCFESLFDTQTDLQLSLRISDTLERSLQAWGGTSRISPIWAIQFGSGTQEHADVPADTFSFIFLSYTRPSWIVRYFSPELLAKLSTGRVWISLGMYNIILLSPDQETTAEIISICTDYQKTVEVWLVAELEPGPTFVCNDVQYINESIRLADRQEAAAPRAAEAFKRFPPQTDDTIKAMVSEFYALLAVVEGRSRWNFPDLSEDCLGVERMASELIAEKSGAAAASPSRGKSGINNGKLDAYVKSLEGRDILVTLNAGLSRLTSQALSGTTPIHATECHFWPHSLLGTGVANVALRNLAAFITQNINKAEFNLIYEFLLKQKLKVESTKLGRRDTFTSYLLIDNEHYVSDFGHARFEEAALKDFQKKQVKAGLEQLQKQRQGGRTGAARQLPTESADSDKYHAATPITYFSGRDGFKNHALTTSAPLMSIAGGNSVQWNLGTFTHELSHRIVSGKLADLFEQLIRRAWAMKSWNDVIRYFRTDPKTVKDLCCLFLAESVSVFTQVRLPELYAKRCETPGLFFEQGKVDFAVEIEELLVHMFDFYHFYNSDAVKYVYFVWLSWAVQPSIVQKFDEYIRRTLIALAVTKLSEQNWLERAFADLESAFDDPALKSRLSFYPEIKSLLKNPVKRSDYMTSLDNTEALVRFFHVAFKSAKLRSFCSDEKWRQPVTVHGVKKNYDFASRVLLDPDHLDREFSVENPLLFLRDYSRDQQPDSAKSAWLLQMLAHNYDSAPDNSGGKAESYAEEKGAGR